jgi:hypothetical protein
MAQPKRVPEVGPPQAYAGLWDVREALEPLLTQAQVSRDGYHI